MATRSHIGIINNDNTVSYIYCHFDGYPEYNGSILLEHYNNESIVNKLLDNGNLSILAENIDPSPDKPHNFGNPQDGVCVYYFRDRNEKQHDKKTVNNDTEYKLKMRNSWVDYQYLFDNGQWKYRQLGTQWKQLTPKICKISL